MSLEQIKELAKKYDGRVAKLFSVGREGLLSRDNKINYVKKFGFSEDDTEQLLMLANDMEIYNFDYEDIEEDDSLEFFGVIHAWYVLSELKVPEAKKIFIDKMESSTEDEMYDWISSAFRQLVKPYRSDMYEYMVAYIEDETHDSWARLEYLEVMKDMVEAKELELCTFNLLLEKILKTSKDTIVNSGTIGICIDLKLTQHHELIKECFANKNVDIDHVGDLEDVEIEMGLRSERETKKELTQMQKMLASLGDSMWDSLDDDEKSMLPFVKKESKVGRNDPCPCGSGKKYKKCCMNK